MSTSEKLGVDADVLLEVPPEDDMPEDEPVEDDGVEELDDDGRVELLPDVLPEEPAVDDGVDGLDEEDDGLDEDDEDCATASDDSAKSTAAVMMLRVLGMRPPEI